VQNCATHIGNRPALPAAPPPDTGRAEGGPTVLCVHFTSDWDEYGLWIAEPDTVARPPALGITTAWDQRPSGVAWGVVSYRQTVACDAILVDGRHAGAAWQHVRDLLRAEGVPRQCAAIVARLRERPLLTTIARGPALSPGMVRRVHMTLLAELSARRLPVQQAARAWSPCSPPRQQDPSALVPRRGPVLRDERRRLGVDDEQRARHGLTHQRAPL
jgi:hypothetical protein